MSIKLEIDMEKQIFLSGNRFNYFYLQVPDNQADIIELSIFGDSPALILVKIESQDSQIVPNPMQFDESFDLESESTINIYIDPKNLSAIPQL